MQAPGSAVIGGPRPGLLESVRVLGIRVKAVRTRTYGVVLVGSGVALLAGLAAADTTVPPRTKGPLLAWLKAGAYRASYTPEPAVRESAIGVHGRYVRSWYSPVLTEDLLAGRSTFRKGAAMVKELYLDGRDEVVGFSVMRKLRRRSGLRGKGWLFYESLDGTNDGVLFGRGLSVCVGCHRSGTDYLRSDFRP
jgi:hypothetical protein